MKKILFAFTILALIATQAQAGSIYAKRNRNVKSLYADDTARQIGDIITIIVSEDSNVDNTVERTLENSSDRSSSFDGRLGVDFLSEISGFTMAQESKRNFEGKSEYGDQRKFTDKVTVVVEDIHPNGNLVILGYRERTIAGDKQLVQISGIIRPTDVAFDNTIGSHKVANFKLVTISEGVSESYNKPGWLAEIFDFFWPF